MSSQKNIPKDAQVMIAILKEAGVNEYEPRVINQMLEFAYRYVTSVLDDAKLLSQHAKKKMVDHDDISLAIQLQVESSFTSPPPRELLLEVSRQKNSVALPLIRPGGGPKLPPDRYCLTACNYHLKSSKKPPSRISTQPRIITSLQGGNPPGLVTKVTPAVSLMPKVQGGAVTPTINVSKPPSQGGTIATPLPTVAIISRPQSIIPTPVFKITEAPGTTAPTTGTPTPTFTVKVSQPPPPQSRPPTIKLEDQEVSRKRKLEDDEYTID